MSAPVFLFNEKQESNCMFLVGTSSAAILGYSGIQLSLHLQWNLLQVVETLVRRNLEALSCNTSLDAFKVVSQEEFFSCT